MTRAQQRYFRTRSVPGASCLAACPSPALVSVIALLRPGNVTTGLDHIIAISPIFDTEDRDGDPGNRSAEAETHEGEAKDEAASAIVFK